jgi:hypothetical protein
MPIRSDYSLELRAGTANSAQLANIIIKRGIFMKIKTSLILLFAANLGVSPLSAQNVQWASKPAAPSVTNSNAVLGQPDGVATSVAFYDYAYVRDFQTGKVSAAQMEKAMKLPAGELRKWDIVAFESESVGSGKAFDSSMWMVQDMQKLASAVYDSKTGNPVPGTGAGWSFKAGRIAKADFKASFGGTRIFADAAWLLIKLPAGVDKSSSNLAVWLGGGPMPGEDNTPAPDAIGVIR